MGADRGCDIIGRDDSHRDRKKRVLGARNREKGFAFIDEIPRNPSGKPLKHVLREQFPGPAAE